VSEHASDEQLSLLLDGELSLTAREAVTRHLASCPGCAARHDELVDITAALRLQPTLSWTQASTAGTLERLQQRPNQWRRPLRVAAFSAAAAASISILGLAIAGATSVAKAYTGLASVAGGGVAFVSPRTLIILGALALMGLLAYPLAHSR